jgi:small subunit ribosomal protein S10
MIEIRCKLKSFNQSFITVATNYFFTIAKFFSISNVREIALPTKIKKFTVIKSPHKYKSSREQFQYTKYKKCLIVGITKYSTAILFIKLLKTCEFAGVELEIQLLTTDYFLEV